MDLVIRDATAADIPAIKELDREVVLFVQGLDGNKDLATVRKRHEDIFERWLSLKDQKIFLAFDADAGTAPIGFVWLVVNVEQFTGVPYMFVMDIMVREKYKRMKVGYALMKHALEQAKKDNYGQVKLMVNAKNKRALKFYRDMGFEIEDLYMRLWLKEPKPTASPSSSEPSS